jgi:hypothetical protein
VDELVNVILTKSRKEVAVFNIRQLLDDFYETGGGDQSVALPYQTMQVDPFLEKAGVGCVVLLMLVKYGIVNGG